MLHMMCRLCVALMSRAQIKRNGFKHAYIWLNDIILGKIQSRDMLEIKQLLTLTLKKVTISYQSMLEACSIDTSICLMNCVSRCCVKKMILVDRNWYLRRHKCAVVQFKYTFKISFILHCRNGYNKYIQSHIHAIAWRFMCINWAKPNVFLLIKYLTPIYHHAFGYFSIGCWIMNLVLSVAKILRISVTVGLKHIR